MSPFYSPWCFVERSGLSVNVMYGRQYQCLLLTSDSSTVACDDQIVELPDYCIMTVFEAYHHVDNLILMVWSLERYVCTLPKGNTSTCFKCRFGTLLIRKADLCCFCLLHVAVSFPRSTSGEIFLHPTMRMTYPWEIRHRMSRHRRFVF